MTSYLLSPPPTYTPSDRSSSSPLYYEDTESTGSRNDSENFGFDKDEGNRSYENQHQSQKYVKKQLLKPPNLSMEISHMTLHDYVRQTSNVSSINQITLVTHTKMNEITKRRKKQFNHPKRFPLKARHNNIKPANNVSKEWLKNARHKTRKDAKTVIMGLPTPLGVDDESISTSPKDKLLSLRNNKLKPLDAKRLGHRSLPQSREFPKYHKHNKRLEAVRRLTYAYEKDEDQFKKAEAFMSRRRSKRANNLLLESNINREVLINQKFRDMKGINAKKRHALRSGNKKYFNKILRNSREFHNEVADKLRKHTLAMKIGD